MPTARFGFSKILLVGLSLMDSITLMGKIKGQGSYCAFH
jgi:hypothetical protein